MRGERERDDPKVRGDLDGHRTKNASISPQDVDATREAVVHLRTHASISEIRHPSLELWLGSRVHEMRIGEGERNESGKNTTRFFFYVRIVGDIYCSISHEK